MNANADTSRLKRDLHHMPDDIAALLSKNGLLAAYEARPPYQRNDYIGWITRAKRPETRQKRIDQMVDELEKGGVYMAMRWNAGDKG